MPGKYKSRAKPRPGLPALETRPYSVQEFAEALGVKLGTVRRWRHEGMPSGVLATGEVMVNPVDALEWVMIHARPSTFAKECLVYFARKDGLIKIGSSIDPKDRLRKMHVEILATVPGDKRAELAFHELFASAAVGNEWFRPVPELLTLIESLKAA